MSIGITNPVDGKTYIYKGFTPYNRLSDACKFGKDADCTSGPQDLITVFDFEYTKKICCLCQCHNEEVK